MDSTFYGELVRDHQRELLAAARDYRLSRLARPSRWQRRRAGHPEANARLVDLP